MKNYHVFLLFTIIITFNSCKNNEINNPPKAVKGILDLREWDLEEMGPIRLCGEWEFYWKEFILPDEKTNKKPLFIEVPSPWNNFFIDGKKLKGEGYATYRLRILLNKKNTELGYKTFVFGTACQIFINGKPLSNAGIPGKIKKLSSPEYNPHIVEFISENNEVEVIMHISNFHHRKGGQRRCLKFGTKQDIKNIETKANNFEFFVLGCILIMAIYNFGLFFYRRKEKAPFFFGVACIAISLRLVSTGEYLISDINWINWHTVIRSEYLSILFSFSAIVIYVYYLFTDEFSKKILILLQIISGLFVIAILILPPKIFSYFVIPFQLTIFISSMYGLNVFIKAIRKKRVGAVALLLGFTLFILTAFNDYFHHDMGVNTHDLISIGLITFIFTHSFAISMRLSRAFTLSEELSESLKDLNKNLDGLVKQRTAKIEKQNKEIKNNARKLEKAYNELQELGNFKEGLTSMVVNDMKIHLSPMIALSEKKYYKDKEIDNSLHIINQSGKHILNMVLNILDIQKFEKAKLKLNLDQRSPCEITRQAIKQVSFLSNRKNIKINNNIDRKYIAIFDTQIIERIIINLITNAINQSPLKSTINIDCKPDENYLKIIVADQSAGIPEDKIHLVFNKFKQIPGKKAGQGISTGFGLSFCKLAVEAHNGEIGVESKINKGSMFWFTIPRGKDTM